MNVKIHGMPGVKGITYLRAVARHSSKQNNGSGPNGSNIKILAAQWAQEARRAPEVLPRLSPNRNSSCCHCCCCDSEIDSETDCCYVTVIFSSSSALGSGCETSSPSLSSSSPCTCRGRRRDFPRSQGGADPQRPSPSAFSAPRIPGYASHVPPGEPPTPFVVGLCAPPSFAR